MRRWVSRLFSVVAILGLGFLAVAPVAFSEGLLPQFFSLPCDLGLSTKPHRLEVLSRLGLRFEHRMFSRLFVNSIPAQVRKDVFKAVLENGMPAPWNDEELTRLLGMTDDERFAAFDDREPSPLRRAAWGLNSDTHVPSRYNLIHQFFTNIDIRPGEQVVELGSGTGRVGIYLGIMRPGVRYTGIEALEGRWARALRTKERLAIGDDIQFLHRDLTDPDFTIPDADYYYAYVAMPAPVAEVVYARLEAIARRKTIRILSYHGGFLNKVPSWLRVVPELSEFGLEVLESTFAIP